MSVRKYKYYFKKPKSQIAKDILSWIFIAGAVCISASSPYFVDGILENHKRFKKYPKKNLYNNFYQMKKRGFINIQARNKQIYISLTPKGKQKAGYMQIDKLKINMPSKWDGKWRIVIFDIAQLMKIQREAFRGKLKELGFCPLQKSVWVHPFDCRSEIELLKDFFGLSDRETRLIIAEDIGDSAYLKRFFNLT